MSSNTNKGNTIPSEKKTSKGQVNRGKKPQGKKPYYQSGGQRGDQAKKKRNSRTLFIGQIYMDDISRSEVSSQLIQHRVSYLKSVLESLGEVENFQDNIESNSYILVTYKSREIAERVLKKLKSKGEMETIIDQIKVQLAKVKIPLSVCPNFLRFKYDWSDKPARIPKNAYSVKKTNYQKEEDQTEKKVNGEKTTTKKTKKSKKPKKKYQKKSEGEVDELQEKELQQVKKEEKVEEKFDEKRATEELRRDAEGLRREADKAKLKDELEYLSKQLGKVESEITVENERCKDRDLRIGKLEEELRRVDQTKRRLENQLTNERNWKKLGQDTVSRLQRELDHIRQEHQSATLRLNQSEDLEHPQETDGILNF